MPFGVDLETLRPRSKSRSSPPQMGAIQEFARSVSSFSLNEKRRPVSRSGTIRSHKSTLSSSSSSSSSTLVSHLDTGEGSSRSGASSPTPQYHDLRAFLNTRTAHRGDTSDYPGDDDNETLDVEHLAEAKFCKRGFKSRDKMRCQPFEDPYVAYPLGYNPAILESDQHNLNLLYALANDVTFYDFGDRPPLSVLDLGCGDGAWILQAGRHWPNTAFFGFDLMDFQPNVERQCELGYLRGRVSWRHGNLLYGQLPFPKGTFDFVRVSFLNLAIPSHRWPHVLQEIKRVLSSCGVVEYIDEGCTSTSSPTRPHDSRARSLEESFQRVLQERGLGHSCTIVPSMMKFIFGGATELTSARLALPSINTAVKCPLTTSLTNISSPPPQSTSPSRPKVQRAMTNPLVDTVVKGAKRLSTRFGSTISPSQLGRRDAQPITEEPVATSPTTKGDIPTGLILLPDTLLPMPRRELDIHVSRATHILLGSKHEIWKARDESQGDDATKPSREDFDDDIWHYETERFSRLGITDPLSSMSAWDDDDDDGCDARGVLPRDRIDSPRTYVQPEDVQLTTVRHIRVWVAQA